MAFNTGNPLGSTDPRDLSDNAENFDKAVNDTANPTFVDRFGNTRVTLANQLGYNFLGDYSAGIELASYTDIIRYNGEFYRPSASATLPYTTTATLPDVDSNLAAIGDANIRQELALDPEAGNGASLVKGASTHIPSLSILAGLSRPTNDHVYLTADVIFGEFVRDNSDISSALVISTITSTSVDDATDTITLASHGLIDSNAVITESAVDGLSANTIYYVVNATTDTFQLSETVGGSAFNLVGTSNITLKRIADPEKTVYVTASGDPTGANGAWIRKYERLIDKYAGVNGSSSAGQWQIFFDLASYLGEPRVYLTEDVASLDGEVDCSEIRIICNDTVIPSDTNTFSNHGGIERGIIAGVNTSKSVNNISRGPSFDKTKFIHRTADQTYLIYMAKKDPAQGYLEITSEDNVTTTTNSIGGNAATRITDVKNINDIIAHKHTFASAGHTPVDTVTRTVGSGGGGGTSLAFWDIPNSGGNITFSPGHVISEVSIIFLLTGGSSADVDIQYDGATIDNISLVLPTGGPDFFIYRKSVVPGSGNINIINNSGSATAYVAGINAYRPGEEFPLDIDIDTFSFTRNTNDYTNSRGAVDYALRRHPDEYSGSDPTGGSLHGGEVIISASVRLDDGTTWNTISSVGDIAAAKKIEFVSNVDVTWPDTESVNVVRLNQIGDGVIFKDLRINAGTMVFDNVWTTMWTTPLDMTGVRGLTAKDISGVSSEFQCYERGNEVRQDRGVAFGIRNSWTLFDDERNSNGGPYIASEAGTRAKLYYGPILFNKGQIGVIHSQQCTEFFGEN